MERTWRSDRLRESIALVADQLNISRTELYRQLASMLAVTPRTVQSWTHPSCKNGPGADRAQILSSFFGQAFYDHDKEAAQLVHRINGDNIYSDFVKEHIFLCYLEMRHFITNCRYEEERYDALLEFLHEQAIVIPKPIREKLVDFTETELSPLVFESDNAFHACESAGTESESGVIIITNEIDFWEAYLSVIENTLERLDNFSEMTLKPVLAS